MQQPFLTVSKNVVEESGARGVQMAWRKSRGIHVIAVPPSWHTGLVREGKGARSRHNLEVITSTAGNSIKSDRNSAVSLTSLQKTRGSESRRVACWATWLDCFFQITCNLGTRRQIIIAGGGGEGRQRQTERQKVRERWGRGRWRGCWFEIIPLIQRTPVSRCFRDRWK